jgi:hypothetical protein
MRSTHPFEQEEVMAYLDGEITADRATEIALHLQRCAECRELAISLRNLAHEFAAWEIEASPARLTEQMTAATQNEQTKKPSEELSPLQQWIARVRSLKVRPWAWAGAGALAVFVLMLGLLPFRLGENASPIAVSRDGVLAPRNVSGGGSGGGKGIVGGTFRQSQPEELRALRKTMAQAEVASSLENSSAGARDSVSFEPGNAAPAPPPSTASAPMIARTASLSLVVKEFVTVESAVKAVILRHSGYIGELNTSTPPDAAKTFSATLRVPSAQMEAALAELKQLGRADQETEGGEEVSKQYTDLAARLKNSRATEERLLGVLRNNTGKVKDVLEVENEISRVRGEIEEMEADQRALQSRIDFAMISLSVTEEYKASLNAPPSSMSTRLHNSFVQGYHNVSESLIGLIAWLLEAGPTLLLWAAILFFPARWVWRRIRRALTATPKPAAA